MNMSIYPNKHQSVTPKGSLRFVMFNCVYAVSVMPFAFFLDGGVLFAKLLLSLPLANVLWYLICRKQARRRKISLAIAVAVGVVTVVIGFTVLGMALTE